MIIENDLLLKLLLTVRDVCSLHVRCYLGFARIRAVHVRSCTLPSTVSPNIIGLASRSSANCYKSPNLTGKVVKSSETPNAKLRLLGWKITLGGSGWEKFRFDRARKSAQLEPFASMKLSYKWLYYVDK